MLIGDVWFNAISMKIIRQRKKYIGEIENYCQKYVYVRSAYNPSFVLVWFVCLMAYTPLLVI